MDSDLEIRQLLTIYIFQPMLMNLDKLETRLNEPRNLESKVKKGTYAFFAASSFAIF
jgi:hypothetical protein